MSNYTPNDPVTLAAGSWTVTVNAFLPYGEGGHRLAASGTAPVTVVADEAGDPVPVVLRPVDDTATHTGNGTFAWDMSFPEITGTVTVEITDLQGSLVRALSLKGSDLLDGTLSDGKDRSQGSIELPAGSYYARTTLTRGGGEKPPKARRKDALFILEGMTTLADGAAGYAFTAGSFSKTVPVTSAADSGAGSLRQALADAGENDTILIALPPGSVIVLETSLSSNKSLTIEGNGVTLNRGAGLTDSLWKISGSSAEVAIRRIHFKDGLASTRGAAIYSLYLKFLALESCVFSGNKVSTADSRGGAVYFAGAVNSESDTLTVLGCTFYNNNAAIGGAILVSGGNSMNVKLGGNLFYGNTTGTVAHNNTTTYTPKVVSLGYNVWDQRIASLANQGDKDFTFVSPDKQIATGSLSRISFRPLPSSGVIGMVNSSAIAGYPTTDFYGDPIPASGAAAGAVQIPASDAGYVLALTTQGQGTLVPNPLPGEDGLYAIGAQVGLTATPEPGWRLAYWALNGARQKGEPGTVTLSEDTEALAVFGAELLNIADEAGLRAALGDLQDDDVIGLAPNADILITSPLPTITKSLVIEGNGATLRRGASIGELLVIGNQYAKFAISRLRFDGGVFVADNPVIVLGAGDLTLESCVFVDNQNSNRPAVLAHEGSLAVLGCTFYRNSNLSLNNAYYPGSAIHVSALGNAKLAGNLFYGNSSVDNNLVSFPIGVNPLVIDSLGYNVSDIAGMVMEDSAIVDLGSGFVFTATDKHDPAGSLSLLSLRPSLGSLALDCVNVAAFNAANPGLAYPELDFFGATIPAIANAGAAQGGGTGYALHGVIHGPGQLVNVPFDAGGLVPSGSSFTLTASPAEGAVLLSLRVDGQTQPGNSFTVASMDKNLEVLAEFGTTASVATEEQFRQALADPDCRIISLSADISLAAGITITRDLVIEGNGKAIAGPVNYNSYLLQASGAGATVVLRRVHIKDWWADAVVNNNYNSALVLESCVFSGGNKGVAVKNNVSSGLLTVLGCTFYNNNNAGGYGGVIFVNDGSARLGGNLFYGNTGAGEKDNVVYVNNSAAVHATVTSLGGNVSDFAGGTDPFAGSGFDFVTGDKQAVAGVSPISFKPALDSPALGAVNVAAFNAANSGLSYPAQDFYGAAIAGTAAAGAAQTPGTGYALNIKVRGHGVVTGAPSVLDADGFVATGANFTLNANATTGGVFSSLSVNGVLQTGNSFTVTSMGTSLEVLAEFVNQVNNEAEFRLALADPECHTISLAPNGVITLNEGLLISRNITIEGNGAVITPSLTYNQSSLLTNGATQAVIRRVHFKDGRATGQKGGAISNSGTTRSLVLESCIFSGNQNLQGYFGGAISNSGALTVLGCAFYNNELPPYEWGEWSIANRGGAIHMNNGTLQLGGNLFYGNTASKGHDVVFNHNSLATIISLGGNVSDRPGGTAATESGWIFAPGDLCYLHLPFVLPSGTTDDFKPLSNGAAYQAIGSRPAGYPTVDFYGAPIPANNAMAGAVQSVVTATGFGLNHAAQGPGMTTVQTGAPGSHAGFYTGSVTLKAEPTGDVALLYWTVNGIQQPPQTPANELTITMSEHTIARAVFAAIREVSVSSNAGAGSLRQALADAEDYDVIRFQAGLTVTLTAALPAITKSLVIEGNGATLTQSGFSGGSENPLLTIGSGAKLSISRLRFKGGRSYEYGAAIKITGGELTLESCIFSDNRTSYYFASGGAIYNGGNLSVSGCTFTGNITQGDDGTQQSYFGGGGAIHSVYGTLKLTGNIFSGNTANHSSVIRGVVSTNGYNVSDKQSGDDFTTGSGWVFNTSPADTQQTVSFSVDFRPSAAGGLPTIPTLPAGFPTTYFDGTPRGAGSVPGAMPVAE